MNDVLVGLPDIKEASLCPPLILFGALLNDMHILCQTTDNQLGTY